MNFVDMWSLKACPGKILRRPCEIEFESNFRVYHNNLMAIYLSDHCMEIFEN